MGYCCWKCWGQKDKKNTLETDTAPPPSNLGANLTQTDIFSKARKVLRKIRIHVDAF